MGRRLVTDLQQQYLRLRHIQTVAVLSALFSWRYLSLGPRPGTWTPVCWSLATWHMAPALLPVPPSTWSHSWLWYTGSLLTATEPNLWHRDTIKGIASQEGGGSRIYMSYVYYQCLLLL